MTTAQGARMGPTKKAGWSDNLQVPLGDGTPPTKPQPVEPNSPFREATCDRAWAYVAVFRRVPGKQEGKKGPVGATVRPRLAEKEKSHEFPTLWPAIPLGEGSSQPHLC